MPVKEWRDVVDKKFPRIEEVTLEMQEAAFRQVRLMRGSARLMLGRVSTTEEIEERRAQALETPLR